MEILTSFVPENMKKLINGHTVVSRHGVNIPTLRFSMIHGEWILWPIEIRKFRGKINTKFGQGFQIILFNKQYTLLYALLSYLGQTKC